MSSTNKKAALELFSDAFERLKQNKPVNIPLGSPITQNNIAREAGRDPSALRAERYPELLQKIQTYIHSSKEQTERNGKSSKNRSRNIEKRLRDCMKQREQLLSVCHSQQIYIEELLDEISRLKTGEVVDLRRK